MLTDITTPEATELQNMRTDIIRMLRTSALAENYKQSVMVMLPYLPMSRVKPLQEKLHQEEVLRTRSRGISPQRAKEFRDKVRAIRKLAWTTAEKENTPPPSELEHMLAAKLSQL